MYNRLIGSTLAQSSRSILLLGPRQVGKSTLIRTLKPDLEIDLANESEYFLFQMELNELVRRVESTRAGTIFVDEIQRIPRLTNTIQHLIDHHPRLKFYLTGSSARKLRRGKANLLPGRIFSFHMSALCLKEIGPDWNEEQAMRFGCLPGVLTLPKIEEKKLLLQTYSNYYLKEEIMAEALVRQIDGFLRFLYVAAMNAGHYLDISKMAKRSRIPRQSAVRHIEILEDTLIAARCKNDPDLDEEAVDLIQHPRLYFFDLGVLNALRGSFEVGREREGFLFEHLIYSQIVNSALASGMEFSMHNFRTRGGMEVDFIVKVAGTKFAIECKAADCISDGDLRALRHIDKYYKKIEKIVIYRGRHPQKEDNIWILPLPDALRAMGLH